MLRRHAALIPLLAATAAVAQDYLPDHDRTPGAVNAYVTPDNVKATACVARWTRWVTPSLTYTNRLKAQQIRELGLPGAPDSYHEDHLVPLCVGAHPRDPRNLWPQPVKGKWTATLKDQLEASVCRAVCLGKMTLEEGRAVFLDEPDWTKAYKRFFDLN